MNTEFTFSDIDLVVALLDSSPALSVKPLVEGQMVRYAFGWATDEEEAAVTEALTLSNELRHELITIQASLAKPETTSRSVREFLSHAVDSAVRAYAGLEQGLGEWKSNFDEGLVVMHALQARSRRCTSGFGGFAVSRSAAALQVRDEAELGYVLTAKASSDGALEIAGRRKSSSAGSDGPLRLEMIDDLLGRVPLGIAKPREGTWRLSIEDFGIWDDATIRGTEFRLAPIDEPSSSATEEVSVLTEEGAYVQLPLLSQPTVSGGRLTLRAEFSDAFRDSYGDQSFELAFNAGPLLLPLGTWAVNELPTDGVLTASLPGSFEGLLPRGAIVASLIAF